MNKYANTCQLIWVTLMSDWEGEAPQQSKQPCSLVLSFETYLSSLHQEFFEGVPLRRVWKPFRIPLRIPAKWDLKMPQGHIKNINYSEES